MSDNYNVRDVNLKDFTEEDLHTVNVNLHYPDDPEYYYETRLERINLDEERIKDINTNNGFIIKTSQALKKDLKSDDSIYSSRFGPTLQDQNPFINRYSCKCGHYKGAIYDGQICEYCHEKVKYLSDNFEYFGWIVIKEPFCLIHPNLYKSLQKLIGPKNFDGIINCNDELDENGHVIEKEPPKDNPFFGIGICGFRDRFQEVCDYYLNKNPNKKDYYDDIMLNKDKVFTHSIPVYTTQLRPYSVDENNFTFEGNNATYNMLASLASRLNRGNEWIRRKGKPNKQILYAMQTNFNSIYSEEEKVLSSKKGLVRSLIGGRCNFCSRVVIIPDNDLKIDEVGLPYGTLIEWFQQIIINMLTKTGKYPSEAYKIWNNARNRFNEDIYNIIKTIIETQYISIFLNRNPSIGTPSILHMRVVKVNRNYTCSVPLEILRGLGADFDGDTLNAMWIINKNMANIAKRIFNPRYAGQISRNDGFFNSDVSPQTDTIICLNTFNSIGSKGYMDEQLQKIQMMMNSKPATSQSVHYRTLSVEETNAFMSYHPNSDI